MTTAAELPPGFLLAGFRIEGEIGRGGMGVVYRATQLSLGRQVALKLISRELALEERFRERFLREARLAASLEHPHLLPVHDAGEAEGTLFLAMRLVDGVSLAEILRREGQLDHERAVHLFGQLASALQAAHAAGLLHRDVKPANVLLSAKGEHEHAYLCDFGLARRLAGGSLTAERAFLGTATYAAPEQIRGEPLDARCDLYALACLLYECLTGAAPFQAEDELALCWAHLHEPVPLPSSLDPALAGFDPFFARALAKDPEQRFGSASELAQAALGGALPQAPPAAGPPIELPRPATPFLGRERELAELLELLLREDVRLLTLTGPGGTGKTRLALRAAEEAAPAFPDGVYWVGLAALRDPALVTETIAQTLAAKDGLASYIAHKRLLLLLDNLEQVVEAAAELASLLQACPNLTLLVTSRELLRLQAEAEYAVPPLAAAEAVELFCARSRLLEPSQEIAEVCARLDNLPLAVELAAARTRALSVPQILERLSQRLDLLKGGRDADPRQQTLRATIEWSYDLLSEEEQVLFCRLAIFSGGCTLEAAEEVCDADLDTLQSFVEKSLLRFSNERYSMLETIREYAAERLQQSEEQDAVREFGVDELERRDERRALRAAHATYFLRLAEAAKPHLHGGREQATWFGRLEEERDNLRSAFTFFREFGMVEEEFRLALATWDFWWIHGYASEGRAHVLNAIERGVPATAAGVDALEAATYLAYLERDLDDAARRAEELAELAQTVGSDLALAKSWHMRALVSATDEARVECEKRALAFAGDHPYGTYSAETLGMIALRRGDIDEARRYLEQVVSVNERIGESSILASSHILLALVCARGGPDEEACEHLAEGVRLAREIGDQTVMVWERCWIATALLLAIRGSPRAALTVLAAADRVREDSGSTLAGFTAELHDQTLSRIRASLDEGEAARAWAEGRSAGSRDYLEQALRAVEQS